MNCSKGPLEKNTAPIKSAMKIITPIDLHKFSFEITFELLIIVLFLFMIQYQVILVFVSVPMSAYQVGMQYVIYYSIAITIRYIYLMGKQHIIAKLNQEMFYFISITINLYFVRSYRKITTRNLETSILRIRNREFKYTDIKVTQFKRKRNFCLSFVLCVQTKKPKRKKKFYSCCK